MRASPPIDQEQGYGIVEELIELAAAHDATPAQVALTWLLRKEGVPSIIFGATRTRYKNQGIKQ